jgi:hypothetical protein
VELGAGAVRVPAKREEDNEMAEDVKNRTMLILVLVLVVSVIGSLVERHTTISTIRDEMAFVTGQLEDATEEMKTMAPRETLVALEQNVVALKEKLSAAEEANMQLEEQLVAVIDAATVSSTGMPDMEEMQKFEDMMAEMAGKSGGDGKGAPKGKGFAKALSGMFEGENGQQMAELSAKMAIDMQYADFFKELDLNPDTEQQVRDIMQTTMAEQMTKGFESLGDGFDASAMEDSAADTTDVMRDRLSEVLDGNQMAIWEEYEDTKQERMLATQYDMQLSMFASGLTEENRALAIGTIVDEVLAMQESRRNDPNVERNMRTELDAQLQAFDSARERLALHLDDRQIAQFDRFIEQQRASMEVAMNMMGGLFGEDETPEEMVLVE